MGFNKIATLKEFYVEIYKDITLTQKIFFQHEVMDQGNLFVISKAD